MVWVALPMVPKRLAVPLVNWQSRAVNDEAAFVPTTEYWFHCTAAAPFAVDVAKPNLQLVAFGWARLSMRRRAPLPLAAVKSTLVMVREMGMPLALEEVEEPTVELGWRCC